MTKHKIELFALQCINCELGGDADNVIMILVKEEKLSPMQDGDCQGDNWMLSICSESNVPSA